MFRTMTSAAALALVAGAAQAFDLTILHTNDFHARFEPISKYDGPCDPADNEAGDCFGGSARLVTAIEAARGRAENSLLLDGGDQFQGTLFYTKYKGEVAAEFMNKLGYDAMTVGNHEFDDGPGVLGAFVERLDFPVLMSNAEFEDEPAIADKIKKSVVIEVGGEKIGLIGLTPLDTPEISAPGESVTFDDPVAAVQSEVNTFTADGIDKIIVLSHSGYEEDQRIAEWTSGVDVIVGGHSNTYLANSDLESDGPYPTMVGDVAIVQAYAYGKFLGELNVEFDEDGMVASAFGEPLIMDDAVAEDGPTVARIAELAEPLDEIRQKVVAETRAPINGDRADCRTAECEMGNLVADAMLDRVRDQGIQIAITNGGGLRASIDEGEVTMGEVFTVLPFQNTLSTFEVSGSAIKEALENAVQQYDDPEKDGRFAQVSGLSYAIDPRQNYGNRISDIMVKTDGEFEPLDPETIYGVVSNNFVRNGGDGYTMFVDAENAYDFGPDLAEVTAEYLAKNAPYEPYTDGRIQADQ